MEYYGIREIKAEAKECNNIKRKGKIQGNFLSFFAWGLSCLVVLAYAVLALIYAV